jgi:glycosyltransferase involved in cell wall biosynthesis
MKYDLSILVCALDERKDTFLKNLLSILEPQVRHKNVELLILSDDATMNIGAKRNKAIAESSGKYFAFVDDDDRVAEDYVDSILAAIQQDADVIVFDTEIRFDGGLPIRVRYSTEHKHEHRDNTYWRQPNHLMAHKRSNVSLPFQDVRWGEDTDWAEERMHDIKTQTKIDKVLYYYDYSSTTEKHQGPNFVLTKRTRSTTTTLPPTTTTTCPPYGTFLCVGTDVYYADGCCGKELSHINHASCY